MDLSTFFENHTKVAIAFSGGVDSAYLLYVAKKCEVDVKAYFVKSAFQPQFELEDAMKLAQQIDVEMKIISVDVLEKKQITMNSPERCYFCKNIIFTSIIEEAKRDGYVALLDGTNASDQAGDRPGMRALKELQVYSPLREAGLTKAEIRQLSKDAGLFTWDKPAYACLATRICTGEDITKDKLQSTENAENFLHQLGLRDFRVRMVGNTAKIQVKESQLDLVLKHRTEIVETLGKMYSSVTLDMETRV